MYVDAISAEGACYSCVPCAARVQAATLGVSESAAALGAIQSAASKASTSVEALHTFTLDSGASRCFFRDCTTVTPLTIPVLVSLADPSGGPVIARASTVLPCLAVTSSSLPCLHLPSFSTNLTLLWHHQLGLPSLPRLRSMHSRLLVSGLPRSLPPLPLSLAPPCLPCVEGRQRAAPHSSSFPPSTAPLQTLYMNLWGSAPVRGTEQELYFLLVIDGYTRYTTVFPLRSKADVRGVLIPWIRATRRQLRERFRWNLPVLRLHSDRGGEFSSCLLGEICRDEGIAQTFTLPASPQQNGIAERRIGLIMEVARTSMIHAAAPHFLWLFAVRYVAHQFNLWPRVSVPETSPTLRWTEEVGDASAFRDPATLAEGGDPAADDTAATRRSPRLETPPGFPPPVAVDSGAAGGGDTGGEDSGGAGPGGAMTRGDGTGGAETGGVGSGGAETWGADYGGAAHPSGGGTDDSVVQIYVASRHQRLFNDIDFSTLIALRCSDLRQRNAEKIAVKHTERNA
ncbi:unnamed protein product [Closterium sp. NIES-54]